MNTLPKVTLTDPSKEEIHKAWKEVAIFSGSDYLIDPAYEAMNVWPYGEVGTSPFQGHRILISWEWLSGSQQVTVRKVKA